MGKRVRVRVEGNAATQQAYTAGQATRWAELCSSGCAASSDPAVACGWQREELFASTSLASRRHWSFVTPTTCTIPPGTSKRRRFPSLLNRSPRARRGSQKMCRARSKQQPDIVPDTIHTIDNSYEVAAQRGGCVRDRKCLRLLGFQQKKTTQRPS